MRQVQFSYTLLLGYNSYNIKLTYLKYRVVFNVHRIVQTQPLSNSKIFLSPPPPKETPYTLAVTSNFLLPPVLGNN